MVTQKFNINGPYRYKNKTIGFLTRNRMRCSGHMPHFIGNYGNTARSIHWWQSWIKSAYSLSLMYCKYVIFIVTNIINRTKIEHFTKEMSLTHCSHVNHDSSNNISTQRIVRLELHVSKLHRSHSVPLMSTYRYCSRVAKFGPVWWQDFREICVWSTDWPIENDFIHHNFFKHPNSWVFIPVSILENHFPVLEHQINT